MELWQLSCNHTREKDEAERKKKKQKDKSLMFLNKKKHLSAYEYDINILENQVAFIISYKLSKLTQVKRRKIYHVSISI